MRRYRFFISASVVLAIVLIALWGPELVSGIQLKLAAYGSRTFAVYLDSGHIFYGKLDSITHDTIVLSDVRTFQKFEVGNSTTNTLQSQVSNPITKPENFLVIQRAHVLFFEEVGSGAPILATGAAAAQ